MASPRQTVADSARPAAAAALVSAAKTLVADRAPSAISGRELADRAGVNYGLVHRHFGSKSAVLGQALDELLAEFARDGFDETGLPIPLRLARHPETWRALAHVTLDRAGFAEYREVTPVLDRCVSGVRVSRPELDREQVHAVVGLALSIETGVPIHRPVLARALGLSASEPAIDRLVARWLDGLYRGWGPLGGEPRGTSDDVQRASSSTSQGAGFTSAMGVEARLVGAGADLLVDSAPSAISGRRLARAAGVNYGLIHHYFGGKDEVLRRSVQLHRDRFFDGHGGADWSPHFFSVCEHPGYVRAMTWGALDPSLSEAPQRFPVTEQMVSRLVRPDLPAEIELTTRVAIFAAVSLQMAWALFLPVMRQAFGADPRQLEPLVVPLLRNLLVDPMHEMGDVQGTWSA
jgi:AcrR family transcriptional regulator